MNAIKNKMRHLSLITILVAQAALAQVEMGVLSQGDAPIMGGSVKLTPVNGDGAFYLINDDDNDGVVKLVDWDGNPLDDGYYSVEVRGRSGNFVRGLEIRIAGKKAYEQRQGLEVPLDEAQAQTASEASPNGEQESGVNPLVVGGGIAAAILVGAVASSGGDSGGGTPPPDETTDVHVRGQVGCQVGRDENNLESIVGAVGGTTDVRIKSGSMQMNMPISGAIAYFTGTYGSEEFRVLEFATISDYPNTELIASGNFYPTSGAIDFTLAVGTNGSFGSGGSQTGIEYVCSGNLSSIN